MHSLARALSGLTLLATSMSAPASYPLMGDSAQPVDQAQLEQLFDLVSADTLDADQLLASIDALGEAQRAQLLGPTEMDGERVWPLFSILGFVIDGASADKARALIEFGLTMAQRSLADTQRGHWLAWVSRVRLLTASEPELAVQEARQARELGTALCSGACGPLVEAWLAGNALGLQLAADGGQLLDARPGHCASGSDLYFSAHDPGVYSDDWLRRVLERSQDALGTDLQRWWQALLQGCEGAGSYSLRERVDREFPPLLIQQSFANARQAVGLSTMPAAVSFLGHSLPLPTHECDFAKAADCSALQPLRAQSARLLVGQLRDLSSSLRPISMCSPGPEGEEKRLHDALSERFETRIKALESVSPHEAIQALELLLVDEAFQALGDDRAYAASRMLARLSMSGEPLRALSLWQRTLASMDLPGSYHQLLLAKMLLHVQRPQEAAALLLQRAEIGNDAEAALAWFRLRAAIEGADLTTAVVTPERPWTVSGDGDHYYSHVPINTGVEIQDILIGTRAPSAAVQAILQASWVQLIEQPWLPADELKAALHNAFPGERLAAEWAVAIGSLSGDPEPGIVFAGQWLPVPDQLCGEQGCATVDADGLRQLLQRRGLLPIDAELD